MLYSQPWERAQALSASPVLYHEVIENDSMRLYFTALFQYTTKECAEYSRVLRMIPGNGKFNGFFEDRNKKGGLLGKGRYINGIKHGDFEVYYMNGRLRMKGRYEANRPAGDWQYFHTNGTPERTVRFTATDTLLVTLSDSLGHTTVNEGNGVFEGPIGGISYGAVIAKGDIRNGKHDGKWTSIQSRKPYCNETFKAGKLVRGKLLKFDMEYTQYSILKDLTLPSYLRNLEDYHIVACHEYNLNSDDHKTVQQSFDVEKFNMYLREDLQRAVSQDMEHNPGDYSPGDRILTIRFTIPPEGKPKNVTLKTGWGTHLLPAIERTLKSHTFFENYHGPMYFHLKLSFNSTLLYNYRYQFTLSELSGL